MYLIFLRIRTELIDGSIVRPKWSIIKVVATIIQCKRKEMLIEFPVVWLTRIPWSNVPVLSLIPNRKDRILEGLAFGIAGS